MQRLYNIIKGIDYTFNFLKKSLIIKYYLLMLEKIRLEMEFISNILGLICLLNITGMGDIPYNPPIEGLRP